MRIDSLPMQKYKCKAQISYGSVPFFRSQIICGDLVETLRPIPEIIRKNCYPKHILVGFCDYVNRKTEH